MRPSVLLCTLWLTAAALAQPGGARGEEKKGGPDFAQVVRPILAKKCFACHGPDEGHRQAGLRLDDRTGATAKLESGTIAISAGNPEASELVRRVTAGEDEGRMPPPDSGQGRLSADEVETIRAWIASGATYSAHWAFVKPVRPAVPSAGEASSTRNAIDAFVQSKLGEVGMQPSAEADRHTLVRRVSLDLRGLPPSPEEVQEFISDESPGAYERLVDRLLADPEFGERWARVWLDLARYADSKGYGSDPLRTIWLYRDWVVDAFNRNLPYDEFTIEQLAGDLLPAPAEEQLVATAFHRNTMTNTEGGTDDEEFRVAAVKDRIDTTMQVWMGLTLGCAKCHSHKYDPITQREYYSFFDFFNQTADNDQPDESPTIRVAAAETIARADEFSREIAALKEQLKGAAAGTAAEGQAAAAVDKAAVEKQIKELEGKKPEVPTVPVLREVPGDKKRATHVMLKGNFLVTGDRVEPGVPHAFHAFPSGAPQNRLGVAQWLVDAENPLTARVAVNRLWSRLFGRGIVETEEDFGTQGDRPTHPELLDWLATEYLRTGWDTKAMLRLMATSATYRQSSRVLPVHLKNDPRNVYLSRAPRQRLEAEMVRDQALALSGLLGRKLGGKSVFPPQPEGLWQAAFNGTDRTWATSGGVDRYRRGLYTFWRRTTPYPSLSAFDAPSREICTLRRTSTNTPLQAFVTLNDPVYVEAAQALARRIVREGGATNDERVRYALALCLARPGEANEIAEITSLFEAERTYYAGDGDAALALSTNPLGPLPEGMSAAEAAAWTVVANVLLNLDGVLTKG